AKGADDGLRLSIAARIAGAVNGDGELLTIAETASWYESGDGAAGIELVAAGKLCRGRLVVHDLDDICQIHRGVKWLVEADHDGGARRNIRRVVCGRNRRHRRRSVVDNYE